MLPATSIGIVETPVTVVVAAVGMAGGKVVAAMRDVVTEGVTTRAVAEEAATEAVGRIDRIVDRLEVVMGDVEKIDTRGDRVVRDVTIADEVVHRKEDHDLGTDEMTMTGRSRT